MSDKGNTYHPNWRLWKNTGFVATIAIVLSFPLFLVRSTLTGPKRMAETDRAYYVGSHTCIECHKIEYDLWLDSHHYHAMDTATPESVRGDFNNTTFEWNGITNRFFKQENKLYVETPGPGGEMGIYEISYTFGYEPLQQYLIAFPGGRLQCLPIAWDTEKAQWFHLYDSVYDEEIQPDDWLYWTNNGQNWNGMCADCHSTDLRKNYDIQSRTFNTTWFEINVGCEACHGPSSEHLDWAKLPDIARPTNTNTGLLVRTSNITTREYVDQCARCHARRGVLEDFKGVYQDVMDYMIPQHIGEPYYFADGQILEEDYVYASFLQSKMFANDVRCNDCHDAHSVKLIKDGNEVCLQCHKEADYETYDHHFHKYEGEEGDPLVLADRTVAVGEGALCVNCHMAGRYYMGNDFRNDHSFRIPRPDLSAEIGVPNACNQCHTNETVAWSVKYMQTWYGSSRKTHYGTVLDGGRKARPEAEEDLIILAFDTLYPVVARATAISLLSHYPTEESNRAIADLLSDNESMVRHMSVQNYMVFNEADFLRDMMSMLYDPVRAVRMNAAFRLSALPSDRIDTLHLEAYNRAIDEYIDAMEYTGDFAASRHNLGILYSNMGDLEKAELNYREAIRIDGLFYPAKMNLAMLYNQMGDNQRARILFTDIIENHPEVTEAYYSYGLLLAEMNQYQDALTYLQEAARLMPDRPRIFYNLGLLYQYLESPARAEGSFREALRLDPGNIDYIYVMADFYIKQGRLELAETYAVQLQEQFPDYRVGSDLLQVIENIRSQDRE
jgi:predicted CXXCH cytochrome family protein